jgi:uncharacterized protein (TIGR00251 family)
MKYTVKVKANARKNEVRKSGSDALEVRVTAPPVDGKANEKLIELIAEYFGVPKRCVSIVRGAASKSKTVEVIDRG